MSEAIGGVAGEQLERFVERIERLEEEKKAIADDIREVKAEAKACGFDVKVINQMVKERRMDPHQAEEFQSLCELYRAALGMLRGTPLGDAARKRMMPEPDPKTPEQPSPPADGADGPPAAEGPPPDAAPEDDPALSEADIAAARETGAEAARAGARVIDNPYVAGDPRRAAWDEGWCAHTGSDGMEIPKAWRRSKPEKKPAAPKGDDAGGDDGRSAPAGGDEHRSAPSGGDDSTSAPAGGGDE